MEPKKEEREREAVIKVWMQPLTQRPFTMYGAKTTSIWGLAAFPHTKTHKEKLTQHAPCQDL